jgi:hypothetical protein
MREYDEYDEEVEEEVEERRRGRAVAYPATVLTAGVGWIVFGSLLLLSGTIIGIILSNRPVPADKPAEGVFGGVCFFFFAALFGAAFIFVGVQSVRGTAPGTLGNGIGSIVFGVLNLAGGIAQAKNGEAVAALISFVCVAGLLGAGILALVGGADYRRWREAHKPRKRARRRR